MGSLTKKEEFLFKEYEFCFQQLRFYDERSNTLLKYLFSLTTAVATAQFAIYKLIQSFDNSYYFSFTFLSLIVFIAVSLIFAAMIQNRLYFTHVARQINSIRSYFVHLDGAQGFENQLYLSTNFPAFKLKSVHTFQLVGATILCGLYAGSFTFSFLKSRDIIAAVTGWSMIAFLVVTIAFSISGFGYLILNGSKSSDLSVHGNR